MKATGTQHLRTEPIKHSFFLFYLFFKLANVFIVPDLHVMYCDSNFLFREASLRIIWNSDILNLAQTAKVCVAFMIHINVIQK